MSGMLLNPYSFGVVKDPLFAYVKNLIGWENGSLDEKTGQTWNSYNGYVADTSSAKFGTYGLPATTGASRYAEYVHTVSDIFSQSGEVLIEVWAAPSSFYASGRILNFVDSSGVEVLSIGYTATSTENVLLRINGTQYQSLTVSGLFDGTYKYFAIHKPAYGNYKLYVNGNTSSEAAYTSNISYKYISLGAAWQSSLRGNAKIDEFRVTTNASPVRGAPTTIPTTAFPRS